MLNNYLRSALRQFKTYPIYSAIKTLSLALGLGCSTLVILHFYYATSYDKHFDSWQNIYRLVTSSTVPDGSERRDNDRAMEAMVPLLMQDYPQIDYIAKARPSNGVFSRDGENLTNEFYWVDSEFLSIFSLDFVRADSDVPLLEPNSIILDESTARKHFGESSPIGETLTLNNDLDLRVTAVYRELPNNTHLQIPAMISTTTARQYLGPDFMNGTGWLNMTPTLIYLRINDPIQIESVSADLNNFLMRHADEQSRPTIDQFELSLSMQPLADIHLSSRGIRDNARGPAQVLQGLSVFAFLILLTSCINFANLSIAQFQQRMKEVGLRRTIGATRRQVTEQFLTESMIATAVAFLIGLAFVSVMLPMYNNLTATEFSEKDLLNATGVASMLLLVLLTGLVSGLLPAFVLSGLSPSNIVKGAGMRFQGAGAQFGSFFRSVITVLQFSLATVLIALSIAIYMQIDHLQEFEAGFDRENLVILNSFLNFDPNNSVGFAEDVPDELLQHPSIIAVGGSLYPPLGRDNNPWTRPGWGPNESINVGHIAVGENYIPAYGMEVIVGRNFSSQIPSEFTSSPRPGENNVYAAIIAETTAADFGFSEPATALDEIIQLGGIDYRIVGVIKDFHFAGGLESERNQVGILRAYNGPMGALAVRLDSAQADSALAHIDAVWKSRRPNTPVNRSFFSETFDNLVFQRTNEIGQASLFSSLVTICIAVMGLFGLAYYYTQRRTKEVGIRKVLGASVEKLVLMLSKAFLTPVAWAVLIAAPITWYLVTDYYSGFSSRANFSLEHYLIIVFGIGFLALVTTASQGYRAAQSNPAGLLRNE